MSIAIKAENLSKIYRLGEIGTGTISRDLERTWARIRGKEDPFLKIGETNDHTNKGLSDLVYSLKDINFEIEQGDAVGIIGRNGAGKSTLLKILSRVTAPTTGRIHIRGRVASLLEVGTGFHPELTGRENIYLNGAILGMRKKEITRKLDEIIDFSGVERYIDTPVKRYSSGMYVRLAFAVAAHLESEILIVDEVLAVGDAEFQKKCLGKMNEVSKGEGRTVLFVSHNMSSIKQLCDNGILLKNGKNILNGQIQNVINSYSEINKASGLSAVFNIIKVENKALQLIEAKMLDNENNLKAEFDISESIFIQLKIKCNALIKGLYGYIIVKNLKDDIFIESDTFDFNDDSLANLTIGNNIYKLKINNNVLPIGEYIFYLNFNSEFADNFVVDSPKEILRFSIVDNFTRRSNQRMAISSQTIKWNKINAES